MDDLLLYFTTDEPCHDEETIALSGGDSSELYPLTEKGFIQRSQESWTLTPTGDLRRRQISEEYGVPWYPLTPFDATSSLENLRLQLLLDRDVTGRWAVKEFSCDERFPYLPDLEDSQLFEASETSLNFLWPHHELTRRLVETFPRWDGQSDRSQPVEESFVNQWCHQEKTKLQHLSVDVTLRNWYDFQHYCNLPPVPGDKQKFTNNDRFFFKRHDGHLPSLLSWLARLHLVLLYQRHIANPGWFDFDQADQWNINVAVVVTENDKEARCLCGTLAHWHDELIGPANPLFLSAVSLEALRSNRPASETICDWLAEKTLTIARPDTMKETR